MITSDLHAAFGSLGCQHSQLRSSLVGAVFALLIFAAIAVATEAMGAATQGGADAIANVTDKHNALGTAFKKDKALNGRHTLSRPFRALSVRNDFPRALPWAGLLPGLWP